MAKKPLFVIDPDSEIKASSNGYKYITTSHHRNGLRDHPYGEVREDHKKKYVYLHRALLELKLNRYLQVDKGEECHHKNGNKTDNRPENLELKISGEHQKDHALTDNPFWKKSPLNKPGRNKTHHKAYYEKKSDLIRGLLNKFFS